MAATSHTKTYLVCRRCLWQANTINISSIQECRCLFYFPDWEVRVDFFVCDELVSTEVLG